MKSVYQQAADLYVDQALIGQPVIVEFLPTQRSRKWRKGSLYISAYIPEIHDVVLKKLREQGNWYNARFAKA